MRPSSVGRHDGWSAARRPERRVEAAYPARPTRVAPGPATDVVDAEVLWEDVEGPSWEGVSPFSFARSPADLVRGYGLQGAPPVGRLVDLRA